jgi:hypothetical protein
MSKAKRLSVRGELQTIVNAALEAGWTVTLTRNGHLRWHNPRAPAGRRLYFSSQTPSDTRALRKIRSDLTRRGLKL